MSGYLKTKFISYITDTNDEGVINIYQSKCNIIIMMDDGWKTQYSVGYSYMKKKNMKGSIAVITSVIGDNNYVNKAELHHLYNAGWDLLNHTHNHTNLIKESYNRQKIDIKTSFEWLNKNGFKANSNILVYPYGSYNQNTIKIIKELNIISTRTTFEGFNPKTPSFLYDIKVKNVYSNILPNEVFEWINIAINDNLTLILLFHKLEKVTDDSSMQYDPESFYKIIDYIDINRNNLNIITYSNWIRILRK